MDCPATGLSVRSEVSCAQKLHAVGRMGRGIRSMDTVIRAELERFPAGMSFEPVQDQEAFINAVVALECQSTFWAVRSRGALRS